MLSFDASSGSAPPTILRQLHGGEKSSSRIFILLKKGNFNFFNIIPRCWHGFVFRISGIKWTWSPSIFSQKPSAGRENSKKIGPKIGDRPPHFLKTGVCPLFFLKNISQLFNQSNAGVEERGIFKGLGPDYPADSLPGTRCATGVDLEAQGGAQGQ